MASYTDRIVVLVDMDCFYCQVEEKLDSNLKDKAIAVVQYNAWKGGGLIAVNYPARDKGVTRHMRGDEAKEKCPEIVLVSVPTVRGKADLTKYREAGKRVAEVLQTFTPLLQRASVDEAYLDITEAVKNKISSLNREVMSSDLERTYVVGCETNDFIKNVYANDLYNEHNLKLLIGGTIVEEIRAAVYDKTGYRCSAGIAHNKILAKLACGMNKPNKQTILPHDSVQELYQTLPIRKIKSLGGKFGNSLSEDLNIKFMSDLTKFSEKDLLKRYDERTALWLYNIARGIDNELVETRLISKSIGCCKKFPGKTALVTIEDVSHWLSELAEEISERLEQDLGENNRKARQIILSFAQEINRKDIHSSRTQNLNSYDAKKIADETLESLKKYTQKPDGSFAIKFLGLSASKFDSIKNVNEISSFFKPMDKNNLKNEAKFNENINENKTNDIKSLFKIEQNKNDSSIEKNNESLDNKLNKKKKNDITNFFNVGERNNFYNDYSLFNKEKNSKTIKNKGSIKNFLNVGVNKNNDITINSETNEKNFENKLNKPQIETTISNNSYKNNEIISNIQNISKKNSSDDEQNLSDIEQNLVIDLNNIKTQNLINKSIINDDSYSNSTIELDYSDILKNKTEFTQNNFYYNENTSNNSKIAENTSSIIEQEINNDIVLKNKTEFTQKHSHNIFDDYYDESNSSNISAIIEQEINNDVVLKNKTEFTRNDFHNTYDDNSQDSNITRNTSAIIKQGNNNDVILKNKMKFTRNDFHNTCDDNSQDSNISLNTSAIFEQGINNDKTIYTQNNLNDNNSRNLNISRKASLIIEQAVNNDVILKNKTEFTRYDLYNNTSDNSRNSNISGDTSSIIEQGVNNDVILKNKTEFTRYDLYNNTSDNSRDSNISGDTSSIIEEGFNNDIKLKTECTRNSFHNDNITDDNNSRSSIISGDSSPIIEQAINNDTSKSFFMRYIKKFETKNQINDEIKEIKNNSNIVVNSFEPVAGGSKIERDEIYNSDSSNYSITNPNKIYDLPVDATYSDNSYNSINEISMINDNRDEICTECNERIPKSNIISHMDHHMALKLMDEERKLFKEELEIVKQKRLIKSPNKSAKNGKIKQVKRKHSQGDNTSIASFLTLNTDKNSDQSETCLECGKKIDISEFANHIDFHAAKKLHLELNPVKFGSKTVVLNKKKDMKNVNHGVQSLSNFFKRL